MNVLYTLLDLAASLPEIVRLVAPPAVLLVAGLLLAIFRAKKAYLPLAVALGSVGFILVWSSENATALVYLALYAVFAVLVWLLFLIPFGKKSEEKDIQDELYEKFHVALDIPEDELTPEDEDLYDSEESGLHLAHATALIEQLKTSELSPSDRLEVDALSHTLDGYRDRELTESEMRALNDCLATILKLTAKYKL